MAGRFPGARNLGEFWENLINGVESISHFTDTELEASGIDPEILQHPNYIKAKGILEDIDAFDADFFGYPPREAERMDPQIRILHECSWEALENAGYNPESYEDLIGFYVGANENQEWLRRVQVLQSDGDVDSFLLNYRDYVATRISNKLDLKGPSLTLLTACSTSMVAIHLACQALNRGECDMALAGGVSLSLPQKRGYFYQEGLMVSADGHCRAFDAKASGTVFGDGVGIVVLKTMRKALDDRDHIRAIVKGSAVNNDGNGKPGFTAPSVRGQKMVIEAAHRAACVDPEKIDYIEAHGTGTRLGDPVELKALELAFRTKRKRSCRIGSVKSNIGHVNIAAGVSSFIKTVLSLENHMIPPSLHFTRSNPEINFKTTSFFVNKKRFQWRTNGNSRLAGVSAFGFGGTNAHAVLEEAPPNGKRRIQRPGHLLLLSARTEAALNKATEKFTAHLSENREINLADAAYTLSVDRKHFPYRRMSICSNEEEARKALEKAPAFFVNEKTPSVAFMFPGQGAQYVHMGTDLYQNEPIFRSSVDICAEILKPHLGIDIREILYPAEGTNAYFSEQLKQTTIAQPTIFTISYALTQLWMSWGVNPNVLIGHSIGEFVAACIAEVFSLEDALYLVAKRGQFMQQLPQGGMLAVPLSEEKVSYLLNKDISLAAVNSPSLCVLSGTKDALASVEAELLKQNADCHYLQTSHAFHSRMMGPIIEPFVQLFQSVQRKPPTIPMISTVTGDRIEASEITRSDYWVRNLRQTVQFSSGIQRLLNETNSLLLEVGPGRTLSTLSKLHLSNPSRRTVCSSLVKPRTKGEGETNLLNTMGTLWLAGVQVDWSAVYANTPCHRIPLPTYPFERKRYWLDSHSSEKRLTSRWDLLQKIPNIDHWFHVPSWKRSFFPPNRLDKKLEASWLLFMDTRGVGLRILERLTQNGQKVTTVYPGESYEQKSAHEFCLNPAIHDHYDFLFQELGKQNRLPQRIIHLWNVSGESDGELTGAYVERIQRLGFYSLLSLAQVMGKQNITDDVIISVISNHMHEVTGSETSRPEKAPVLGLVKVIPQEYSNVQCTNIDFVLPEEKKSKIDQVVENILAEMSKAVLDPVVAYRGNHRWVQHYEQMVLEKPDPDRARFRKKGVYLITGGLGGIGLVLATHLARIAKARLILTGRSAFPERKLWTRWLQTHDKDNSIGQKIQALKRMEKYGAQVLVVTADVTDREKMREALAKANHHFGPIHGVIHAAGLPGEGIIQLKKHENAEKILASKIQGTLILDSVLKDQKLDFFVLCSSIASILGGIGLADYSSANSFLDSFAGYRQAQGRPYIAINWDMWGEVGMGLKTRMPDELQAWLEKELRDGITTEEGIDVFQRILAWQTTSNVIVSTRDLQSRIDLWIKREFIKEKERSIEKVSERPKYTRPILSTEYEKPANDNEEKVAQIWSKLFGIDRVGRKDNFYELGGHSLLATTLVNQMKREFNTNLSIQDVLDHPVVLELAEMIANG